MTITGGVGGAQGCAIYGRPSRPHEPHVLHGVPGLREHGVAQDEFAGEEAAEEVLHHDEARVGLRQDVRVVELDVHGDPHGVQEDHGHRDALEPRVHSHAHQEASFRVVDGMLIPCRRVVQLLGATGCHWHTTRRGPRPKAPGGLDWPLELKTYGLAYGPEHMSRHVRCALPYSVLHEILIELR